MPVDRYISAPRPRRSSPAPIMSRRVPARHRNASSGPVSNLTAIVDEDWQGRDPEALRAVACKEVPLLPGATHCFVSATLTRDPRHPLGRVFGDTLVLVPSALGKVMRPDPVL